MTFPLFRSADAQAEKPYFIGAPYHGVVVDGTLDLSGSGGPVLTGYFLGDGRVNALSNPNRTLPTRTVGEIAADAALGRVYEPYALVKTGQIYGKYNLAASNVSSFYFDSRGYFWLVEWDISLTWSTETISGDVTFTRILHLAKSGAQAADFGDPHVVSVSISATGTAGDAGTSSELLRVSDYTTDGEKVLFRSRRGIFELTISDTIDEGGVGTPNPYPYGGGTIEFNVTGSVLKTYAEVTGTVTGEITYNNIVVDETGATVASPSSYCNTLGNSGVNFCALKTDMLPDVFRGTWEDYIFAVSYSMGNTVCYWSVSLEAIGETTFIPTNTPGGVQEMDATDSVTITLELKRNGITIDTKSANTTRTYNATADLATLPPSTLVTTRNMSLSSDMAGITSSSGSLTESGTGIRPTDVAAQIFSGYPQVSESLIGAFALKCSRIEDGIEEPSSSSPAIETLATLGNGCTFEEFGGATNCDLTSPGLAEFQSNKFYGLHSALVNIGENVGLNDFNRYEEVLLGTGYSADSSQVPDTTVRSPGTSSYGLPLAYNPWTDDWYVSSWDSVNNRWKIVGFV